MPELPELQADDERLLRAIVRGREAWTIADRLPDVPGGIDRLIALDLVAPWDAAELKGPAVTLTPWAAFLMGVEIRERIKQDGDGYQEIPYWAPLERPEMPLLLPKHSHEVRLRMAELILDRAPPVSELLGEIEGGPEGDGSPEKVLMGELGPVLLFGATIKIDGRIKRKGGKGKGKRAGANHERRAG